MDNTPSWKSDGGWTVGALIIGMTTIGLTAILPQLDANRRLAFDRSRLAADLDQINRQTTVNEAFLAKIESDPQLAQRLAERQMKVIRQGESLLVYKSERNPDSGGAADVSPFSLLAVPAAAPVAPYHAPGGILGGWLLDPHIRLHCLAGGFFLVAAGLVLGSNEPHGQSLGN